MSSLISSLTVSIKFYNYKVNALCVVGLEALKEGKSNLANAINKEALCLLDYCNSLREAKKLLREDKKLKAEMSTLYGRAICQSQAPTWLDYLSYEEEDEDNQTKFDCSPSLQEKDLEDFERSFSVPFKDRGLSHQSKSKPKWLRSGKTARVLSNR